MYGWRESTASMTDSLTISDHGWPFSANRSTWAIMTPQKTPAVKGSSGIVALDAVVPDLLATATSASWLISHRESR